MVKIKDFFKNHTNIRYYKYRFCGKKISYEKLKNILLNNYNSDTELVIRYESQKLPFYKGAFEYFIEHYTNGIRRIKVSRVYIEISKDGVL